MYELQLNTKECISCGICMDVCKPRAISMLEKAARSVEGLHLAYENLDRGEFRNRHLMTFPYLSCPELCDGCGICVRECPVTALGLSMQEEAAKPCMVGDGEVAVEG